MILKNGNSMKNWVNWDANWTMASDWRSASDNVVGGLHDLLFVEGSDLVDSSLSVELDSEGLVCLDKWVELTGEGGVLTCNNFNVVV